MKLPARISFAFIFLVVVLVGWLQMGALLLSVLFSYFAITKLAFIKPRGKWLAVAVFLAMLAGLAYALTYFIQATVQALPNIAEKAVPVIIQWAGDHHIKLPFTDLDSLKDKALRSRAARRAIWEISRTLPAGPRRSLCIWLVGCLVAIGLFLNPRLELEQPSGTLPHNLYSLCCEEISQRFATFYRSFDMVMKAQVTISAIDTVLTGIFMASMGLPHLVVAVGVTFLCGLIPVVGNLVSNTLVVAFGFMVRQPKDWGPWSSWCSFTNWNTSSTAKSSVRKSTLRVADAAGFVARREAHGNYRHGACAGGTALHPHRSLKN